jgi:hypothetical protein
MAEQNNESFPAISFGYRSGGTMTSQQNDLPRSPVPLIAEWPADQIVQLWKSTLQQIVCTLQARTNYIAPPERKLTRWPDLALTFEEYNAWRQAGDRQRKASDPAGEPRRTEPPTAAQKKQSEARSRLLAAAHAGVRRGLICVPLAGWDCLTLQHQQGMHMALDIADRVRCQTDRRQRVVEHEGRPVLLADHHALSEQASAAIDDIATQLGHFGMGELLSIASNYKMTWIMLTRQFGTRPPGDHHLLVQRQPISLATADSVRLTATAAFADLYAARHNRAIHRAAALRREGYIPASHRYA